MTIRYATDYGTKRLWTEKGAFSEAYLNVPVTSSGNPINSGDTVYFGIVPAGTEIHTCEIYYGAMGAGATLSVGWIPVPASASLVLPNGYPAYGATALSANANLTAWASAISVATAGFTQATGFPQLFDFDVILVGTAGGANYAAAKNLAVVLQGKVRGAQS